MGLLGLLFGAMLVGDILTGDNSSRKSSSRKKSHSLWDTEESDETCFECGEYFEDCDCDDCGDDGCEDYE